MANFHNPYNFIPALPRASVKGELGDRHPSGHNCYLDNYWSGRITVKLRTVTPLLIPDAAKAQALESMKGHKTYPLRLVGNQPYLPPTSIKGMLRSAYEAITNSRLSIFSNHTSRLAYRMEPTPNLYPAIVKKESNGQLVFRIIDVVKLLCYKKYNKSVTAPLDKGASEVARERNYPDGKLPKNGDALWVKLAPNDNSQIAEFQLRNPRDRSTEDDWYSDGWLKAWACVTGPNSYEKRYERVFIEPEDIQDAEHLEVTPSEIKLWGQLIKDYQTLHKDDLEERQRKTQRFDAYLGHEPGKTGWSHHVYTKDAFKLKPGTLCYLQINPEDQITAVLPVTVSRQLFQRSPQSLLPKSLRSSTDINSLSPADRVFGWVNQEGAGAYRGQLRIHSVNCETEDAIAYFTQPKEDPQNNPGIPLAILGQPKPEQVRFYVSQKDENGQNKGQPLPDGTSKKGGYQAGQGLRGRKVYPHHKQLEPRKVLGYWEKPGDYPDIKYQDGLYREYRRPPGDKQRDSQNRSIQAWVKPGTEFQFEIDVINLSNEELGALLWLLQLKEGYYHRLGNGKPLGFGSVELSINWETAKNNSDTETNQKTDLRLGQSWKDYYQSLLRVENADPHAAARCIQQFQQAVIEAYPPHQPNEDVEQVFSSVRFIQAFSQAARGFDDGLPIHYPRTEPHPNPDGEGFDWFVKNEKGSKRSLPALWNETGLPRNP